VAAVPPAHALVPPHCSVGTSLRAEVVDTLRYVPQQTDADGAYSEASGRHPPHRCGSPPVPRGPICLGSRPKQCLNARRCSVPSAVSSDVGSEGDLAKMRYTVEHESMVRKVLGGDGKMKIKDDEWIFDRM
jgi:hypothetical protein